ncbi:hypothetical protein ACTJIJ_19995 [Niabella sp. 22666]|uniref:hypothetical protein n=1 Tax=Niabella sp. 22666 TaxID=3453954 RepID=UPI003F85CEDE
MNIYSQISNINKTAPKPGGLCKIQFIAWEQILSWPNLNPYTNTITDDFVFKPGFQVFQLNVAHKDRVFREELKISPQGEYYDQLLACRGAGFNRSNNFILQAMAGGKFVVFFTDKYGDLKILGSQDCGAEFLYNYSSGDSVSTRSVSLQFKIESVSGAIVVDDFIPTIPDTGIFALEFSTEFE